jgi:hypothetical protein
MNTSSRFTVGILNQLANSDRFEGFVVYSRISACSQKLDWFCNSFAQNVLGEFGDVYKGVMKCSERQAMAVAVKTLKV